MGLPFIVWLGALLFPPNLRIQSSISAYYHTVMRDVFVGVLFIIGFFLLTYNPRFYDKSYGKGDQYLGILAGMAAIAAALFPTSRDNWQGITPRAPYPEGAYGVIHLIAAIVLFGSMIYFSNFLFTETTPGKKIRRGSAKEKRNKIYRAMALIMLICVILIVIYFIVESSGIIPNLFTQYPPVFFLEWAAIWAFGITWSVKGEALERFNEGVERLEKEALELRKRMGLRLH